MEEARELLAAERREFELERQGEEENWETVNEDEPAGSLISAQCSGRVIRQRMLLFLNLRTVSAIPFELNGSRWWSLKSGRLQRRRGSGLSCEVGTTWPAA